MVNANPWGLDFSRDLETVCNDFLETCVLKITGQSDIYLHQAVLSEPREWKELDPSNAQVLRQGTEFIWSKYLSPQPPIGSIIVDAQGTYWTVWKLVYKNIVETWEARCLNLSIVTAAANQATVLKATYTHAAAGEAQATWFGLFSNVLNGNAMDVIPARFQPDRETAQIQFGSEFSQEAYKIYLDKPFPAEAAGGEFRMVDQQGNRYRILEYWNEERIDRLPCCLGVRITEGSEYFQPGGPPAPS